jgi:hypothetical protein
MGKTLLGGEQRHYSADRCQTASVCRCERIGFRYLGGGPSGAYYSLMRNRCAISPMTPRLNNSTQSTKIAP